MLLCFGKPALCLCKYLWSCNAPEKAKSLQESELRGTHYRSSKWEIVSAGAQRPSPGILDVWPALVEKCEPLDSGTLMGLLPRNCLKDGAPTSGTGLLLISGQNGCYSNSAYWERG